MTSGTKTRNSRQVTVTAHPHPLELHVWSDHAACRGASPTLFITEGYEDDDPIYPPAEAEALCNRCPVRPECLQYGLETKLGNDWLTGVWGGTTAYQRRQLRRSRERSKCPNCDSTDLVLERSVELCLACGVSWPVI